MLSAILQAIQALLVLLFVIAFGFWLSRKGLFDNPLSRGLVSKIVNASLPFFLFHSVISKFGYEQFLELLKFAGLPFLTVFINFLFSVLFIKLGWVRKEIHGTFIAAFSAATVLFVGVPLVVSMFGSDGVPYLLVYFFANCVFFGRWGCIRSKWTGVSEGICLTKIYLGQRIKKAVFTTTDGFHYRSDCGSHTNSDSQIYRDVHEVHRTNYYAFGFDFCGYYGLLHRFWKTKTSAKGNLVDFVFVLYSQAGSYVFMHNASWDGSADEEMLYFGKCSSRFQCHSGFGKSTRGWRRICIWSHRGQHGCHDSGITDPFDYG